MNNDKTYLDTAMDYGKGLSETRVGMVMKTRRKEVWLATKVPPNARTRDEALREVEQRLNALSLPVATAVIGMPKLEFVDQNVATAKSFKPMNAGEMDQLRSQVASKRASLEPWFSNHHDASLV